VPAGYTMVSIADYDGDGLADILWSTGGMTGVNIPLPGVLQEWLSNGSGGFTAQAVADMDGKPVIVSPNAVIQANRLQGGRVTSGVDTSVGISH